MDGCIYRTKDGECDLYAEGGKYKAWCEMENCDGRKMSNADRIRSMTDEELAWFIYTKTGCDHNCMHWKSKSCNDPDSTKVCGEVWLDWLKQENETN